MRAKQLKKSPQSKNVCNFLILSISCILFTYKIISFSKYWIFNGASEQLRDVDAWKWQIRAWSDSVRCNPRSVQCWYQYHTHHKHTSMSATTTPALTTSIWLQKNRLRSRILLNKIGVTFGWYCSLYHVAKLFLFIQRSFNFKFAIVLVSILLLLLRN